MTPPQQLAAILIASLVAGAIYLIIRYQRNRRKLSAIRAKMPSARRVGSLGKQRLLELRRTLGTALAKDAERLPKHEVELTRHALWLAMLLEAGADNKIDAAEIEFVAKLYGEIVSNEPNRRYVLDAGDTVLNNRYAALAEISKAAGISMQSKMHILQGAFLVSVANRALESDESKWLREIADALAINRDEQILMFDELADSLDLQVAKSDLMFWERRG